MPIICFMLAHLVVPFFWSWGYRRVLTHFSALSASLGSKYVVSKLTAIGINCCVQFAHPCVSNTCFKFAIANGEGFFFLIHYAEIVVCQEKAQWQKVKKISYSAFLQFAIKNVVRKWRIYPTSPGFKTIMVWILKQVYYLSNHTA